MENDDCFYEPFDLTPSYKEIYYQELETDWHNQELDNRFNNYIYD